MVYLSHNLFIFVVDVFFLPIIIQEGNCPTCDSLPPNSGQTSRGAEVIHGKVQEIQALSRGRYSIRAQMPDKELVQEGRVGRVSFKRSMIDMIFVVEKQGSRFRSLHIFRNKAKDDT